ncbi:hypothetical protein B6A42_12405 [Vibrio coralliilyticus]|nr:hypothetical protein B6A42_12405 [Vibrio coralliilyticus]
MKKFIIFTLVSFGAIAVDDKESVVWQQDLTANRTLIEQANVLKDSVANTDTMTRLLYQQYFDIQARNVERTVTIVDYYPDFIDTEEYGSKSIYFDRYEQQVDIIAATTISPQGELVNVDPKLTKLLDTHSENTFTDQQQLLIPLPSLKKAAFQLLSIGPQLHAQSKTTTGQIKATLDAHTQYLIICWKPIGVLKKSFNGKQIQRMFFVQIKHMVCNVVVKISNHISMITQLDGRTT